jgi:hypothetical protein
MMIYKIVHVLVMLVKEGVQVQDKLMQRVYYTITIYSETFKYWKQELTGNNPKNVPKDTRKRFVMPSS